jgi:hypothetical protein
LRRRNLKLIARGSVDLFLHLYLDLRDFVRLAANALRNAGLSTGLSGSTYRMALAALGAVRLSICTGSLGAVSRATESAGKLASQ